MNEPNVFVACTPIPDGIELKGEDRAILKLNIQLTPTLTRKENAIGGDTVSLRHWVRDISQGSFTVRFMDESLNSLNFPGMTGLKNEDENLRLKEIINGAQAIWEDQFRNQWDKLLGSLEADPNAPRSIQANGLPWENRTIAPGKTRSYDPSRTHDIFLKYARIRMEVELGVSNRSIELIESEFAAILDDQSNSGGGTLQQWSTLANTTKLKASNSTTQAANHQLENWLHDILEQGVSSSPLPLGNIEKDNSQEVANFEIWNNSTKETLTNEVENYFKAYEFERIKKHNNKDMEFREREAVRRKLNGIKSLPTLAKFLSFSIDIEIPFTTQDSSNNAEKAGIVGNLEDLHKIRYIAVTFNASGNGASQRLENPRSLLRAACSILTTDPLHFRPLCRIEDAAEQDRSTFDKLYALKPEGFINLKDPRFRILHFDDSALLRSKRSEISANSERQQHGHEPLEASASFLSRGLELIDKRAREEVSTDIQMANHRRSLKYLSQQAEANTKGKIASIYSNTVYAEDLLAGYRVDVNRLSKLDSKTGESAWRSLCNRNILYRDIFRIYANAKLVKAAPFDHRWHPFEKFKHRDDGFVRALSRIVSEDHPNHDAVDKELESYAVAEPKLFSWCGESLAIGQKTIEQINPVEDLNVDLDYRLPLDKNMTLPALRVGERYQFALRAAFIHGGGPELSDTNYRTTAKEYASNEVSFKPAERISAPQLLLPEDDWVVKSRKLNDPHTIRGDSIDRAILRTTDPSSPHKKEAISELKRFLVPPRVHFTQAELQGQFDKHWEQPQGAFPDIELDPKTGEFPHAIDGRTAFITSANVMQGGAHRGAILQGRRSGEEREAPYFVDARAAQVGISVHFVDSDGAEAIKDKFRTTAKFWNIDNDHPDKACPILLKIGKLSESPTSDGVRLDVEGRRKISIGNGERVFVNVVRIDVAPAVEAKIKLWCFNQELDKTHLFGEMLWNNDSIRKAKIDPLVALKIKPLTFISDCEELTLVHALDRPLLNPGFAPNPFGDNSPNLNIVKLPAAEKPRERWSELLSHLTDDVKKNNCFLLGRTEYGIDSMRSHIEGQIGYFTGKIELDYASTREIRCDAIWLDPDNQKSVRYIDIPDGSARWQYSPIRRSDTVFAINELPRPASPATADNPHKLDLTLDENSRPRFLNYDFGTRARRIALRLVATSRFVEYFSDQGAAIDPDQLGRFQRENFAIKDALPPEQLQGEYGIYTRTGDSNNGCEKPYPYGNTVVTEHSFWLPATVRPAKPQVVETDLVFSEKLSYPCKGKAIKEKRAAIRLWLKPRSWHDSGEGELLAVICRPHDLVDEYNAPAGKVADPHLSPGEESRQAKLQQLCLSEVYNIKEIVAPVSRWGADPTTLSDTLYSVIGPENFGGYVAKRPDMTISYAPQKDTSATKQNDKKNTDVAILAYQPELDSVSGRWYVDVDITTNDTDSPFIQLAVARYQPHALQGLELSEPIKLDAIQVPPIRTVEMEKLEDSQSLRVRVFGVGYSRRQLAGLENFASSPFILPNSPLQSFRLLRKVNDLGGGIAVHDDQGHPVEALQICPKKPTGYLIWESTLKLPKGVSDQEVYVNIIEEELSISDEANMWSYSPNVSEQTGKSDSTSLETKHFFSYTPRMFACDISLAENHSCESK